jgi:hypothetical protein
MAFLTYFLTHGMSLRTLPAVVKPGKPVNIFIEVQGTIQFLIRQTFKKLYMPSQKEQIQRDTVLI